jgi:hypothetical protein
MGVIALLLFVMLAAQARRDSGGGSLSPHPTGLDPNPPPGPHAADVHHAAHHARQHAARTAQKAANTGTPADQHAANQAAQAATVLTKASTAQAAAANAAPAPWPAATPSGLAPWPSGWEPDRPPPPAVVTRANQLIPILWRKGAGAKTVEQTAGRWITYVASPMGKLHGVVAFRQKARANA